MIDLAKESIIKVHETKRDITSVTVLISENLLPFAFL